MNPIEMEVTISLHGISTKLEMRIPVVDGRPDYEHAEYARQTFSDVEQSWYADMDIINMMSYSQLEHIRHEAKRQKLGEQGDGTYKVAADDSCDVDVMDVRATAREYAEEKGRG